MSGQQARGRYRTRLVEGQLLATVLVLLVVVLRFRLREELTLQPMWLVPAVTLALLGVLLVSDWRDLEGRTWSRVVALVLVGLLAADSIWSSWLLVLNLVSTQPADAQQLIATSLQVLATNVVSFALLYWQLDRGGPAARERGVSTYPDFLFPQMTTEPGRHAPATWAPRLPDYLYTAFTAILAFSPTDTMPLTHRAKGLMTLQAVVAMLTLLVTLSRAINVLPGN